RCIVSLLSSGWDQVVPMLYGRQAIRCCAFVSPHGVKGGKSDVRRQGQGVAISCSSRLSFNASSHRPKLFGCYMVKPHGQLVLVSSTPHSAYTPSLSTS